MKTTQRGTWSSVPAPVCRSGEEGETWDVAQWQSFAGCAQRPGSTLSTIFVKTAVAMTSPQVIN